MDFVRQADGMLRETAHEMSLIAFEKKQLLQQWKGALIGLARRDEALTAANNALKEAEMSARSVGCAKVMCRGVTNVECVRCEG